MKKPTKIKIQEWKDKYGDVFELIAEDGKVAYVHDPLFDFAKIKLAFAALGKDGNIAFAVSVLVNCWLDGDKEILEKQGYANGLSDQIDSLCIMPEFTIERGDADPVYTIKVGDQSLRVKKAMREDIMVAERRNANEESFQTAAYLLDSICVDKDKLEEIKKTNRVYMGFLRATNQVKDKTFMTVKKL